MKLIKKTVGRRIAGLFCLILMILLLPTSAFASTAVDMDHPASLRMMSTYNGTLLDGAVFDVWRVGDIDSAGHLTLSPDLAGYSISLEQGTTTELRALAQTLMQYIVRDDIPKRGSLRVPSDTFLNLEVGLYLVCGHRYTDDTFTYEFEPFLVSLPSMDKSGDWIYDVRISPKAKKYSDFPATTTISVLKKWEDDGAEQNRPEEIEVQLIRDEKVHETVILSAKNNWRYTWLDLSTDYSWNVTEKTIPKDYTLLISKEGVAYVLVNTYAPEITEVEVVKKWEDKGHESERPTSIQIQLLCDGEIYDVVTLSVTNQWKHTWTNLEKGHRWNVKEGSTPAHYTSKTTQSGGEFTIVNTYRPSKPSEPSLPQTGQLWWPVPVLLCLGVLFLVIGFCTKKHD